MFLWRYVLDSRLFNDDLFKEQTGKLKSLVDTFNGISDMEELEIMIRYLRRCKWNSWAAKMVIDILDSATISQIPDVNRELDKFLGLAVDNLPDVELDENEKLDTVLELLEWKFSEEEVKQIKPAIEMLKHLG